MKLCIDPGHGMDNARSGVFDPGCMRGGVTEADIVMDWARELASACHKRGVDCWLARSEKSAAPLSRRVKASLAAGCTHLISLHVNDADSPKANGTETLYVNTGKRSVDFAGQVQGLAVRHLELRNRGIKARPDLAILKHPNAVLLELGFIGSSSDLAAMRCPSTRARLCDDLADLYASLRS